MSCPRYFYMLHQSGKQQVKWLPCGKWACESCATYKRTNHAERLIEVAGPVELWSGVLSKDIDVAVRKAVQRKKADFVGIRLQTGERHFIANAPLKGRGWGLEEIDLEDLVTRIVTWSGPPETRVDWSKGWRPVPRNKAHDDPRVVLEVLRDNAELRTVLDPIGVDPALMRLDGDVLQTAERIKDAFKEFNKIDAKRFARTSDGQWSELRALARKAAGR